MCLNLDYWHKHSDKRFLLLGHVIYPAWVSNSTYSLEASGIPDFSAETQMWRVGTCHTNVHDLTLAGGERRKPLCYKCSPVFMPESCSPFAQCVPLLPRKSSLRTAGFFPSWTVVIHVVWNSHSRWGKFHVWIKGSTILGMQSSAKTRHIDFLSSNHGITLCKRERNH